MAQRDHERNTPTGRVVARIGSDSKQEVGFSALTGTIRNDTRRDGRDTRRNAVAVYYKAGTGRWKVMLEVLRYSYGTSHPRNRLMAGSIPTAS